MPRDDARTVYSTGRGRVCPSCGLVIEKCVCGASPRRPRGASPRRLRGASPRRLRGASPRRSRRDAGASGDGVVRVRREVRRGRSVIAIHGVPLADGPLRELARALKRRCATGGSVKDGVIEIQGDHRDVLCAELEARGYTVKRSGG